MINKETILKLYNGEFHSTEIEPPKSLKYKENIYRITEIQKKILNLLSESDRTLVDIFLDNMNEKCSILSEQTFIEPFFIGTRLTTELFMSSKK